MSSAIVTHTGRIFDPINPDPALIDIEDIAHALSNQCRYSGHTRTFYSVAQHSVHVAELLSPELALWGLLHDAPEAYIQDMATPLKHGTEMGDVYRTIELGVWDAIRDKFGLGPFPRCPEVEIADRLMLEAEVRDLMPPSPLWDEWLTGCADPRPVVPVPPLDAKQRFLLTFDALVA